MTNKYYISSLNQADKILFLGAYKKVENYQIRCLFVK
jgi:hypothetical protein